MYILLSTDVEWGAFDRQVSEVFIIKTTYSAMKVEQEARDTRNGKATGKWFVLKGDSCEATGMTRGKARLLALFVN